MIKKIIRKEIILAIATFFLFHLSFSQDLGYAKRIIDSLTSGSMYGRGYINQGDKIAATFLKNEMIKLKLDSFSGGYFQTFPVNINTIEGEIKLTIGKTILYPGTDFLVDASSPTAKGSGKIFLLDSAFLSVKENLHNIQDFNFSKNIMVIDKKGISDKDILNLLEGMSTTNYLQAKAFIYITDKKLTWGLADAQSVNTFPVFEVSRTALPDKMKKASFSVNSKFTPSYQTQNVVGFIKGKVKPDSFFVFTAHYDHLGMMGNKVLFPGAHDNASGVAMSMNLMKYYANPEHTPDYSMVFIATSAEEMGILGSEYFCAHPLFDLSKIKFLLNLDMMSTGDDGIMLVNGGIFTNEYDKMVKLNAAHNYVKTISKRGEAKNSDHWYFYKKGVKCFFIYTLGGKTEYHNINDKAANLPMTEYDDIFKLLLDFVKSFN